MELLGAVRAAFGRFGENLAATRKSLIAAANNLNTVEQNSRGIVQRLKRVVEMEEPAARALLERNILRRNKSGSCKQGAAVLACAGCFLPKNIRIYPFPLFQERA